MTKRRGSIAVLAALLAFGIVSGAQSAAGSLDPTFGVGGRVTDAALGPAFSVALAADGKIVAVGASAAGTGFAVTRYDRGGTLDATFGNGGHVTTAFGGGSHDLSSGVAIQPDGKIVVVGQTWDPFQLNKLALARYETDGSLDPTFGTAGKVVTSLNRNESLSTVAIQPDGSIVVAGFRLSGVGGPDMIVLRYTATGRVDLTFANGSLHSLDFGGTELAFGLALQPDGKVLVGGSTQASGLSAFALARYNGDGSLDNTFGSGGKVVTDFGGQRSQGFRLTLQADGKILAVGETVSATGSRDFALARYNADGSLDGAFGFGGFVTTDFGGASDTGESVAVQPDGKIVVVGGSAGDFAVARYAPDGSPDTAFGAGGRLTTDFGGSELADDVAIQPDGGIVAAGGPSVSGVAGAYLVRYLGDDSDVTPPVVSVPASASAEATSSSGAVVFFAVTASDPDGSASTPVCVPASGSTFPIGTTTVTCTSSDTSGNVGSASFVVTVIPTALPDRYAVTSGNTLSVAAPGVLANDAVSSVTGASLVAPTSFGALSLSADGSLTYAPPKGFVGTEMFDYVVLNAGFTSRAATVTLSVIARGADCALADYAVAKDGTIVMKNATLGGCYLVGAALAGANLGNASLVGADLAGASLVRARLVQANFTRAVLDGADLSNADLSNANLTGSTLAGANLSGVIWSKTTCPDGTMSTANACIGHLG